MPSSDFHLQWKSSYVILLDSLLACIGLELTQLMMQSRVGPLEKGKNPTVTARTTQSRVFPQRLLQFLAAFLLLCICFSVISTYMIQYFEVNNVLAVTTTLPSFQPCVVEEPTSLEQ
ncbi:hypothetical protein ACSBR2_037156 [Camellia fascicularis]